MRVTQSNIAIGGGLYGESRARIDDAVGDVLGPARGGVVRQVTSATFYPTAPGAEPDLGDNARPRANLLARTALADHVRLAAGRLPEAAAAGEALLEVAIGVETARRNDIEPGDRLDLHPFWDEEVAPIGGRGRGFDRRGRRGRALLGRRSGGDRRAHGQLGDVPAVRARAQPVRGGAAADSLDDGAPARRLRGRARRPQLARRGSGGERPRGARGAARGDGGAATREQRPRGGAALVRRQAVLRADPAIRADAADRRCRRLLSPDGLDDARRAAGLGRSRRCAAAGRRGGSCSRSTASRRRCSRRWRWSWARRWRRS